jgi:hypothetical protein
MLRGTCWVQQNPTSTATQEAEVVLSVAAQVPKFPPLGTGLFMDPSISRSD